MVNNNMTSDLQVELQYYHIRATLLKYISGWLPNAQKFYIFSTIVRYLNQGIQCVTPL